MPELEEFCRIEAKLNFIPIGPTPSGRQLHIPFEGTATSSHWEGERAVSGVDYVTVGKDGNAELYIRAILGSGDDVVAYEAHGRGGADGIKELITFRTASADLAFLNGAVAVAVGRTEGNKLSLTLYLVNV